MQENFADFATNRHLLTALFALFLAQILKVLFDYWYTRSWKKALAISPGGMPSSHSALTVALMASIGIHEGFGTTLFAISAVLALVVMYDAAGVRRAAGEQAKAINIIFERLEDRGLKLDKKLKELLGHRPIEVIAGALLGMGVAGAVYAVF
ncbi:MAG: divergent PAP2 family protein [Defluviitaleaceae bacterium]|nr:divergent PAP2 family protein [Defluviitaleaceae bacterium]MCL2274326.1 divergent PAP2 family protein [Defluviitaleaceae bacterium]